MSASGKPTTKRHPIVVVGVDGSPNSLAALHVAGEEAVQRGATLKVIYAYGAHVPQYKPRQVEAEGYDDGRFDHLGLNSTAGIVDDAEREGVENLERYMKLTFGDDAPADVQLEAHAGAPNEVLPELATHADLLVLGARGHNGPLALLLGSTAQFCARHATCPVLVVPATGIASAPLTPVGTD